MVCGRQFLEEHLGALLALISGSAADGTAALSLDLITWAVEEAKSNAKQFVDADGFHHVAWLLAKSASAENHSTDLLLAQMKAAHLVSRVCEISDWYTNAALEAGILGTLLNICRSGRPIVRAAAMNALIACIDMLEESAKASPHFVFKPSTQVPAPNCSENSKVSWGSCSSWQ